MKTYVADTHAIIWRLCVPGKLGPGAKAAFDEADRGEAIVIVGAVVVAEMLMVALKQRVPEWTEDMLHRFLANARSSDNFVLTALTVEAVMVTTGLRQIPELFDRLVAAEAVSRGVPVITRDPAFSGHVPTVW
jgi:PIN domain nuclease of toxin-antitoxin system